MDQPDPSHANQSRIYLSGRPRAPDSSLACGPSTLARAHRWGRCPGVPFSRLVKVTTTECRVSLSTRWKLCWKTTLSPSQLPSPTVVYPQPPGTTGTRAGVLVFADARFGGDDHNGGDGGEALLGEGSRLREPAGWKGRWVLLRAVRAHDLPGGGHAHVLPLRRQILLSNVDLAHAGR